jgi:hypothetical protein
MKKLILLCIGLIITLAAQSQLGAGEPDQSDNRFFIGLSYSYMNIGMELSGLSLHSEWFGSDLGTTDLTNDEISEINGFVDRNSTINALCVEAGMKFLDKPESDWKINGSLLLGIAENITTVENTNTGEQEYSFNSGFSKPCLGIGFDVGYRLSEHWGLSLRPYIIGSMGNTAEIKDGVNPDPINFIAEKEDKYQTLYLRASLFAAYTAGSVTIYAGPGFYDCWTKHEYRRQYTGTETGEAITEKITSTTVTKSFIDGSIAIAWRITEAISLNAHTGFGSDLMVDAGIHYNF